jgi:anti-sigma regulatory factor (Ser/Thr protein kinase)
MPSNHTSSIKADQNPTWKVVVEVSLSGQPDSNRPEWEQIITALGGLNLSPAHLYHLKTTIVKATLNAIEHSNPAQPDLSVFIRVFVLEQAGTVGEADQGLGTILVSQTPAPVAIGSGQRLGQAWGFFLLYKMRDEEYVQAVDAHHTVELFLYREGDLR